MRLPRTGRAPSPLAGEGWGGGWCEDTNVVPRGTPTPDPSPQGGGERKLSVCGIDFEADLSGAIYWPEERTLVVADLHLEKGSSFAARGVLLPPYDTTATLARLAKLSERYRPTLVVTLGDSFHDGGGAARMPEAARAMLKVLQRGRDWLWLAGNHDPDPPQGVGGGVASELAMGVLAFRHQPSPQRYDGEIAGHLHPMARVARRGPGIARRCFAADGKRLVMPAFGAYAGGLNVR